MVFEATTEEGKMRPRYAVALSILAGALIGGAAVQTLNAQIKPPVYLIAMNEVTDQQNYLKEFSKPTQASVKVAGGRYLTIGGSITPLDGTPPKARIVIQVWESMEKLKAWYNSPEFEAIRKNGMKYATFHTFAVEGVAE
jgi:uncharacterized protein (DUF1330 family)